MATHALQTRPWAPTCSRQRPARALPLRTASALSQPFNGRGRAAAATARDAPLRLQFAVRPREPRRAEAATQPWATASPPRSDSRTRAVAGPASEVTVAEVVAARTAWADAVSRRDLDAVCSLYDCRGARLLGTLDCHETGIRATACSIQDYFRGFLLERHVSVAPLFCDAGDDLGSDVLSLGPGVAAYSGYYAFRLQPAGAPPCVAHAKFTFVFRRSAKDGRLLIRLHNSGLTPAGVTPAAE